jgi:hypothetical protein
MFSNRNSERTDLVRLDVGELEFEVSYWNERRHGERSLPEPDFDALLSDFQYKPVKLNGVRDRTLMRRRAREAVVVAPYLPCEPMRGGRKLM